MEKVICDFCGETITGVRYKIMAYDMATEADETTIEKDACTKCMNRAASALAALRVKISQGRR